MICGDWTSLYVDMTYSAGIPLGDWQWKAKLVDLQGQSM